MGRTRIAACILGMSVSLAAAPQQSVFRTQVRLVEVDAVAQDTSGRPVTDLRQDEFQVYEDGHLRDVASFVAVHSPQLPPHRAPARDVASNDRTQDGRLIFLVLDDVHTLKRWTEDVRAAAHRLVGRLGPDDQVGVLWLSLNKQGAREFTSNHAAVLRAIDSYVARASGPSRGARSGTGLPDARDPDDTPAREVMDAESRDVQGDFERVRPLVMIREVSQSLARIRHRRKSLVYLGQGPAGRLFAPNATSGLDGELDVIRALNAARHGNVAVYAIGVGGGASEADAVDVEANDARRIPNSLAAFAAQTGGAAAGPAGMIATIDRVVDETGSYYLLGYYADPPESRLASAVKALAGDPWRGFRSIEVRCTRPGVTIRARRGYWADDLATPTSSTSSGNPADRATAGPLPAGDLALRAVAVPFKGARGSRHDVAIAVEVRAPEFGPNVAAQGFTERADLTVVAVEAGEKVRFTERVSTRMVLDQTKARTVGDRYVFGARASLEPGHYQLRIGVRSERAGRSGSVYLDLEVPEFGRRRLSFSGLALEQRTPATRPIPVARAQILKAVMPFVPTLSRTFAPTDDVWVFARVYSGPGPRNQGVAITASIEQERAADPVRRLAIAIPSASFGADGAAVVHVRLPLNDLSAGSYRLVVSASGPESGEEARQLLDFDVRVPRQ